MSERTDHIKDFKRQSKYEYQVLRLSLVIYNLSPSFQPTYEGDPVPDTIKQQPIKKKKDE
jgi:hypothetical protein